MYIFIENSFRRELSRACDRMKTILYDNKKVIIIITGILGQASDYDYSMSLYERPGS